MKLFPKLALTFSSLLIASILCLSASFYWSERRIIRAQATSEQQAILQNLVHIAEEAFLTRDDLLLVKYTHWLAKWNPSMVSASVVDPQGRVVAHSEPSQIGKPQNIISSETQRKEILVLTKPVQMGTHWIGNASVAFSQQSIKDAMHGRLAAMRQRLIEVGSISLLISLVLCLWLAISWTRPIAVLAQMAERIGKGKWDINLGLLEGRRDELGFLSRSFHRMADQLRELDEMKEDFVSAVTHELRSPLGAIESYLNVIAEELYQGISLSTWENYLQRLRVNTQRLTRFVNDLLDVAALDRGTVRLECQPFDAEGTIRNVLDLFAVKLREKRLSAEVQSPPMLPWVNGDAEKVHQVVVNLLANAIKFTPENGHIMIQVEALDSKNMLQVSITDTGVGISEEDQVRIFNKFQQVHSARASVKGPKGTGLGLAISRKLVEMHGGTLSIRSTPGNGSTFYFTLPQGLTAIPSSEAPAGRAG